jgi:fatty acid desaturase
MPPKTIAFNAAPPYISPAVCKVPQSRATRMDTMNPNLQGWYQPRIDKAQLKQLMQRRDGPAWVNTILFFTCLIVLGYLGCRFWRTVWAVPIFFAYGTVFTFANARWHEFGHRTAFKTRALNDFFYEVTSFMAMMESYSWRWSHTNHHSRTIHVGYDYEIAVTRPADLFKIFALETFGLFSVWSEFKKLVRHAFGIMTPVGRDCVPESERGKMIWNSRLYLLVIGGFIIWAFAIHSFLPLMYIVTPQIYGRPLLQCITLTQHAGLAENLWDHRLSTRTVMLGPVLGFLYLNMQYHIEHHIFPQVPFYNLPKLHELVKDQMPRPYAGLWDCYREMIPALIRQARDATYFIKREVPVEAAA